MKLHVIRLEPPLSSCVFLLLLLLPGLHGADLSVVVVHVVVNEANDGGLN